MALSADTKLGPYRITDQIGGGGMGEVYRATDTRLDRTVAIKVLRQEMADNRERRERFEREAKAISSLNHPHICTLYDVGEQDGLEQRLQRGRLPLDQALEFAVQIADALDKAHRHGVVHRDLKPGNIMITRSGVKLLDFGLAKLTGDKGVISPMSQMPTQASANLTADGAILGTLQYMAPEQLEGKNADNRTDIFAFGGVVYEMATGQKAFN
ncbi:MAG: serine/threonine protein kinase, partial [Acidobacteria bacterium]